MNVYPPPLSVSVGTQFPEVEEETRDDPVELPPKKPKLMKKGIN